MEPPAPFGVEPLADCIDERSQIVACFALDLGYALWRRGGGLRAYRYRALIGHDA